MLEPSSKAKEPLVFTEADAADQIAKIETIKKRWMVGVGERFTEGDLPAFWWPIIAAQPEARRSNLILALLSQHQLLLATPHGAPAFSIKADLPQLDLPTLPSLQRSLFRRCHELLIKKAALGVPPLLALMAARGVSAHPADWLPNNKEDDLPKLYWPWCRWVANSLMTTESDGGDRGLTDETWDEYYPAERLAILREMRLRDAQAAQAIIERNASKEPAEKRLKLIETLAINLGLEDVDYLTDLTHDRSQKVARFALQLLARLNVKVAQDGADEPVVALKELVEKYQVKKTGLIKKQLKIIPLKLKSTKQQAIRTELLEKVIFNDFAEALLITPAELAGAWRFDENRELDNQHFILCALSSASDAELERLLQCAIDQIDCHQSMLGLIQLFVPRLSSERREDLMFSLLNNKGLDFRLFDCLQYLNGPLPQFDWAHLQKTKAWQNIGKTLKEDLNQNGYVADYYLSRELIAAGLFLPAATAQRCLDALIEQGALRADPILDVLKLNTQLTL